MLERKLINEMERYNVVFSHMYKWLDALDKLIKSKKESKDPLTEFETAVTYLKSAVERDIKNAPELTISDVEQRFEELESIVRSFDGRLEELTSLNFTSSELVRFRNTQDMFYETVALMVNKYLRIYYNDKLPGRIKSWDGKLIV